VQSAEAWAVLTPDEGYPCHRLGELKSDFPNIGFLVPTSYAKDLGHIALYEILALNCFAFDTFFFLCTLCADGFSCNMWTSSGMKHSLLGLQIKIWHWIVRRPYDGHMAEDCLRTDSSIYIAPQKSGQIDENSKPDNSKAFTEEKSDEQKVCWPFEDRCW